MERLITEEDLLRRVSRLRDERGGGHGYGLPRRCLPNVDGGIRFRSDQKAGARYRHGSLQKQLTSQSLLTKNRLSRAMRTAQDCECNGLLIDIDHADAPFLFRARRL